MDAMQELRGFLQFVSISAAFVGIVYYLFAQWVIRHKKITDSYGMMVRTLSRLGPLAFLLIVLDIPQDYRYLLGYFVAPGVATLCAVELWVFVRFSLAEKQLNWFRLDTRFFSGMSGLLLFVGIIVTLVAALHIPVLADADIALIFSFVGGMVFTAWQLKHHQGYIAATSQLDGSATVLGMCAGI